MNVEELRKDIDRIDDTMLELLATRSALAREIGRLKKKEGKRIMDKKRENEIIERLKKKAVENDLDDGFVEDLFRTIITKSREEQK